MTAREVVDLIKQNAGAPWNERSYRDTFKAEIRIRPSQASPPP